jgi:hypothetical protein
MFANGTWKNALKNTIIDMFVSYPGRGINRWIVVDNDGIWMVMGGDG